MNRGRRQKTFLIALGAVAILLLAGGWFFIWVPARYSSANDGCVSHLRQIDAAKQWWALENHRSGDATPTWNELRPFLGGATNTMDFRNGMLVCPDGGIYTIGRVNERTVCSLANKWPKHHTLP